MRVSIFANPIAGRGKGRSIAQGLRSAIEHCGHHAELVLDSAAAADVNALRDFAPDAAIAIGGDGTIRGVADLLLRTFSPDKLPPILIVPFGTANLMARHLRIDWHAPGRERAIVSTLEQRRVEALDAARANGSLFLLIAGVGIDGAVVHELSRLRSGPIDLSSYVLPAALALQSYAYPALRVVVDDCELFASAPAMAFVGNVCEYGTGFAILPHARSDDGWLDVCVLPCKSRPQVIDLVLRAAAGEHLRVEGVAYTKGRRVRIESREQIPVQLDGDASGHTPLDIELLPIRVPFIVP